MLTTDETNKWGREIALKEDVTITHFISMSSNNENECCVWSEFEYCTECWAYEVECNEICAPMYDTCPTRIC